MATATPIQNFKLDRAIFNETLYTHLRDFWFSELPAGASTQNEASIRLWYGFDRTPEQKAAHDDTCRQNFGHALEAVGPDKLALPAFESHEKDVEQADTLSKPFLEEVQEAQRQDEQKGSDTLLSLVLLLDQVTRNIYRDPAGLRLVFGHYDRIAHALVRSSMNQTPNPIKHESHRLRPVIRQWFLMPLMHCEHLASHDLFLDVVQRAKKDAEDAGNQDAVGHLDNALDFEHRHIEPLKRFGRYPHRNQALGRESAKEEKEFLESGETFGVQQQQQQPEGQQSQDGKNDVKEKSEL